MLVFTIRNQTSVLKNGRGWRSFPNYQQAVAYIDRQNERERKIRLAMKCGYNREIAESLFSDPN